MPFTVQLDLDASTETTLCALADRLAGIAGLETVRQIGDVHHVSLAVCDELAAGPVLPALAGFAATLRPLEIRLAHVGVFPGVLFLAPLVTPELLELHRRFHAAFAPYAASCWEHYRPGAWVPHVTLALNAGQDALEQAVAAVAAQWKPAPARLDALRLIEFRPVRTLFHARL